MINLLFIALFYILPAYIVSRQMWLEFELSKRNEDITYEDILLVLASIFIPFVNLAIAGVIIDEYAGKIKKPKWFNKVAIKARK